VIRNDRKLIQLQTMISIQESTREMRGVQESHILPYICRPSILQHTNCHCMEGQMDRITFFQELDLEGDPPYAVPSLLDSASVYF